MLPHRVTSLLENGLFVGLENGAILAGPKRHTMRFHSSAVTRMVATNDKYGIWSLSRNGKLALTGFEFNCEKAWSIHDMFL